MMKRMMFACAAMAALQVAAITATKEYVDRKDAEIRTNTYTRAETDARIAELSPPPGITTNDVCNIVTNEVSLSPVYGNTSTYTWTCIPTEYDGAKIEIVSDPSTEGYVYPFTEGEGQIGMRKELPSGGGTITWQGGEWAGSEDLVATLSYGRGIIGYTLGSQTNIVLASTNAISKSDFATKGELEDVADAQEGFLRDLAASSNRVDNLAGSVNVLWSHVYGNSVWIAVTNYLRTIEGVVPSFQLWEVRDGATNCVYSSAEEITNLTAKLIKDGVAKATNGMPSKAWSKYQSGTGAENPQPGAVTIVSTPNIMLTGGGEWYKCIETGDAAVWVLKSNGLWTGGGDTNGYFRIVDDEGTPQFEIVKTTSFEVDAIASDTEFDASDNFTVTYNSNMANPPTLYAAANLDDPFVGEDASHNINSLGISVAWAKNGSGYWVATVHQDSRLTRLFIHAKVLQEGRNAILNTAPTILDGGLIIGGIKYNIVPYYSIGDGKTYMTLEAAQ